MIEAEARHGQTGRAEALIMTVSLLKGTAPRRPYRQLRGCPNHQDCQKRTSDSWGIVQDQGHRKMRVGHGDPQIGGAGRKREEVASKGSGVGHHTDASTRSRGHMLVIEVQEGLSE